MHAYKKENQPLLRGAQLKVKNPSKFTSQKSLLELKLLIFAKAEKFSSYFPQSQVASNLIDKKSVTSSGSVTQLCGGQLEVFSSHCQDHTDVAAISPLSPPCDVPRNLTEQIGHNQQKGKNRSKKLWISWKNLGKKAHPQITPYPRKGRMPPKAGSPKGAVTDESRV
ncbi:uncharacterized protein LOC144576503 [Callithrix jacchus]